MISKIWSFCKAVGPWNSSSNAWTRVNNLKKCQAEPKNHIWKQSNISLILTESKGFLKTPFFRKLASKRHFVTPERKWAFDEHIYAKAAFENNQALVARSQKQFTFWNRYSFATRAVLFLRIPLDFYEQSEQAQIRCSKTSERFVQSHLFAKSNRKVL